MPRYYFSTRIGEETIADTEGEELRDADQAWEVAKAMVVDLLREEGAHPDLLKATLIVTDDTGAVILEFPYSEALGVESGTPTKH